MGAIQRGDVQTPGRVAVDSRGKVKVCHLVVTPELHGSQNVLLQISDVLDRDVYECHVICQGEGPLTEELDRRQIRYHLAPSLDRPIRPWRDLRAIFEVRSICKSQDFDILHTHNSKGGLVGRIAGRYAGVPAILHHVHGFSFHEFTAPPQRWILSQLEKFAGRYCDRVVFVNNEERTLSIDRGWLPASKCVTIRNGVDLRRFSPRREDDLRLDFRGTHDIDDDELAILVSGRLERQKQPLILPDVAAQLAARHPREKWRIFVAGSGSQEIQLRKNAADKGVANRFVFLGWVDQAERTVLGSDIALLPSLWEGLPLVLIEAQAGGLPIVASNVKGNREVVTEATGFLCEPRSAEPYAKALACLLESPSLRAKMGSAARQRAESHFDVTKTLADVPLLYQELLGTNINQSTRRRVA